MGANNEKKRREKIRKVTENRIHSGARGRIDTSDIISQTELSLLLSGHDRCLSEYSESDDQLINHVAKRTLAKVMRFQGQQKRDYRVEERVPNGSPAAATSVQEDSQIIAERRELFARINLEIQRMGEVYYRIYHLRFFCDATLQEICKDVNLSRRKLDTHLQTIYRRVRHCLGS